MSNPAFSTTFPQTLAWWDSDDHGRVPSVTCVPCVEALRVALAKRTLEVHASGEKKRSTRR
ncbi:MAG: hypothetical protein Q8S13_04600 [Dehalococcoidia bacterium]|nr:hypothetical protein [Dehalococcoidia bacterium]